MATSADAARPIAILSPLAEESRALRRAATDIRRLHTGGPGRFVRATLNGRPVVLGWTGDGRRQAREGLVALLACVDIAALVVLGVAGGLSADLKLGDVLAGAVVHDADGPAPPPDAGLLARASHLPSGLLYTHHRILAHGDAKRTLGERLRRETAHTCAAVDLETAVYARVAEAHGVPYLALRAISDPVDDTLAIDFARFADPDGATRRGAVILHALTRPWTIPHLLGLARRVARCSEALRRAVGPILA